MSFFGFIHLLGGGFCNRDWPENDSRKRPKLNNPEDALRFICFALFEGVKEAKVRNRLTSRYFTVLSELEVREVPPAKVVSALKEGGGIGGLEKSWQRRQKSIRDAAGATGEADDRKPTKPAGPSGKSQKSARSKQEAKPQSDKPADARTTKSRSPSEAKAARRDLVYVRTSQAAMELLKGKTKWTADFKVRNSGKFDGRPVLRFVETKKS